jgi:hypothetical protein
MLDDADTAAGFEERFVRAFGYRPPEVEIG